MILIFSEDFDLSTNQIMDWIQFCNPNAKIARINVGSTIEIVSTGKDIKLKFNSDSFFLKSIKSIWYRRINSDCFGFKYFHHKNLDNFLRHEYFNVTQYIFFYYQKRHISMAPIIKPM